MQLYMYIVYLQLVYLGRVKNASVHLGSAYVGCNHMEYDIVKYKGTQTSHLCDSVTNRCTHYIQSVSNSSRPLHPRPESITHQQ